MPSVFEDEIDSFVDIFTSSDAVKVNLVSQETITQESTGLLQCERQYPDTDIISLPPMSYFKTVEDYYRTLFHEIGHWTAHPSRCNRPLVTSMSSPQYREEELVAEIASVFLCQLFNIPVDVDNSAAYLQAGLSSLRIIKLKYTVQ